MGRGYWVIIGDGFSIALSLINPRLLSEANRNWWPADGGDDNEIIANAWAKHNLAQYQFARVVLN